MRLKVLPEECGPYFATKATACARCAADCAPEATASFISAEDAARSFLDAEEWLARARVPTAYDANGYPLPALAAGAVATTMLALAVARRRASGPAAAPPPGLL